MQPRPLSSDRTPRQDRLVLFERPRPCKSSAGDGTGDEHSSLSVAAVFRPFRVRLVDSELVGSFIARTFLDPDDDGVLDEIMAKDIAPGITVATVIGRETSRAQMKQQLAARAEQPAEISITPQRRRQTARKRLDERTKTVAARVLQDLDLSRNGREAARALGKRPDANVKVVTRVLHAEYCVDCASDTLDRAKEDLAELRAELATS